MILNPVVRFFSFPVLLLCFTGSFAHGSGWKATPSYPKAFIENKGQFDGRNKQEGVQVLYAIDQGPVQVYFTKTGITTRIDRKIRKKKDPALFAEEELRDIERKANGTRKPTVFTEVIHQEWIGANPNVEIVADGLRPDRFHYAMGPNNIHFDDARAYTRIRYIGIYPGIDIEYTFHPDSGYKYAYYLESVADPSLIRIRYSGDIKPTLDGSGNIRFSTQLGELIDHAPLSFLAGRPQATLPSAFHLEDQTLSFHTGKRETGGPWIIDPWVVFPSSPNSNKVWEVETDAAGNVYSYAGDMPFTLRKYSPAGILQWTYLTSWDSAGFWVGGMVTHPNGDTYMTSGSNGEIRKINSAGIQQWYNNPNSFTSYEYWSPAFNCDLTELVVGGSRATFSIPTPIIRGTIMRINLGNGSIINTTVVGYGNVIGFPPDVQEVSSLCSAPNGNYYFLTLDSIGAIDDNLTTIQFKNSTSYNFDYYIPGYGFGTKQPISAIRADMNAFFTHNGVTLDKRDLNTGTILASATIPGGISNATFFGTNIQGNGGLDIDSCGNIYVGSGNAVCKYSSNLVLLASQSVPGPVYDVDVGLNGEVAFSGAGFTGTVAIQACDVLQAVCINGLSAGITATPVTCSGQCDGSVTANPVGGTAPFSYFWNTGATTSSITGLCPGLFSVTITDANGLSANSTAVISQPLPLAGNVNVIPSTCGASNGSASATASGGTTPYAFSWSNGVTTQSNAGLVAGSYTVLISDANGCTVEDTAIVATTTGPSLNISANQPVCSQSNGSITISVTGGTPAYTYQWSNGTTGATVSSLSAGTYTVTVNDASGCSATDTITLMSSGGFQVSATTTPGCGSGEARVTPSGGSPPFTYQWSPIGGNTSSITGLPAGNYTCIITASNGCTETVTVTVTVYAIPVVTAGSDQTINPGDSIQLTAGGGLTYSWYPSTSLSCITCPDPFAAPATTTTYCVTATDANGCTAEDCVQITVNDIDCGEIFVPDAFAPDEASDPENRKQCVYGKCIVSMEFAVYSRWGEKVFETTDQSNCWDGTYKGQVLNGGVYAYTLKATLSNGKTIIKKGDVKLIR